MRNSITVLLAASLVLAGCGGWSTSRVNPGNWFGKSRSAAVDVPGEGEVVNPLIPKRSSIAKRPDPVDTSVPITTVTELLVERTTTGAIIRVTGIAARQGAYDIELRPDALDENTPGDVLSFTFRVVYRKDPTPVGSEHTRTIHAAHSLTNQDLTGVRLIRVVAEQNVRETRRR